MYSFLFSGLSCQTPDDFRVNGVLLSSMKRHPHLRKAGNGWSGFSNAEVLDIMNSGEKIKGN